MTTAKVIRAITVNTSHTLNKTQITVLRRRIVDKMCKNPRFCLYMIASALRIDSIKDIDIIAEAEKELLLRGFF